MALRCSPYLSLPLLTLEERAAELHRLSVAARSRGDIIGAWRRSNAATRLRLLISTRRKP